MVGLFGAFCFFQRLADEADDEFLFLELVLGKVFIQLVEQLGGHLHREGSRLSPMVFSLPS